MYMSSDFVFSCFLKTKLRPKQSKCGGNTDANAILENKNKYIAKLVMRKPFICNMHVFLDNILLNEYVSNWLKNFLTIFLKWRHMLGFTPLAFNAND